MSAKDFHAVYGLLVLFFPGVVFVFFSTFVQQGRPPAITKDTVGGMVAVAVLYIFIVWSCGLVSTTEVLNPLLMFANEGAFCQLASRLLPASLVDPSCSLASPRRLQVFCIFVLAPAAYGIGWGQVVRKKLHFKLAKRLRLELADTGCAWDVAFEMPPSGGYVIVTLKDGMTVAGYLESRSAISNDPGFRDIFIGDTVGLDGQSPDVTRGTWIAPDQIRTIELVSWRKNPQSEDRQRSASNEQFGKE